MGLMRSRAAWWFLHKSDRLYERRANEWSLPGYVFLTIGHGLLGNGWHLR